MKIACNSFKNILSRSLIFFVLLLNSNFITYAEEDDLKELSYNSIVEVESYEIEGGVIEAGEETNILITLHNANRRTSANSVVITVTSSSKLIYPPYGSDNQFVVGSIDAGESRIVTVPIVVDSTFTGEYADLNCDITYAASGKLITNNSLMVLPAKKKSTIQVDSLDVSAHAVLNGKSLLSVNYSNNGDDNIDDAQIVIKGKVSESTKTIDLGYLQAGKSYTKDYNVIYTESGDQTISIELDYIDTNGELVQLDVGTYKVNVSEKNTSEISKDSNNSLLTLIGRIVAFVSIVIAAMTIWLYIKKR